MQCAARKMMSIWCQVGANGDLPIHRACINQSAAGYEIVRLILTSAPELVRKPGRDGALPLHMACANTVSVKVVKDLVAMYPGGATLLTNRGDTPLHHACINQSPAALKIIRYVLIPHPEALMHPGINGDLPLHLACALQPSVDVIRELISQDARALRLCNKLGDLPLHRLCLNQSADARHLSEVRTHNPTRLHLFTLTLLCHRCLPRHTQWPRGSLCIQRPYSREGRVGTWLCILHVETPRAWIWSFQPY